jgi:predicted DNA-binding protein YlxM (UPF0122 family)
MANTITLPQLAKQLNVSAQALHQRLRRGTLRAEKIDGIWHVDQEEAQRLINDSQVVEEECQNCGGLQEQVKYLKQRIEWLEGQVERQTILLAKSQDELVKALPSPANWFQRLFFRRTPSANETR